MAASRVCPLVMDGPEHGLSQLQKLSQCGRRKDIGRPMQVYDIGCFDGRMAAEVITREGQGEDRVAQPAAIDLDSLVLEKKTKELLVESGGFREYRIEAIAVRPDRPFSDQQAAVRSRGLESVMQPKH